MSEKKTKQQAALRIAHDFSLPIALVTSTQAILAKKGAGKTYKASVQAEEMLELGQQIVVLDPTGAWWGLRSSADGASVGYPITILGGKHGDVPLESTAGEVIAEAIINDGFSAIIDLSSFTKGEEQRFCGAFLETLYRKNERPIHLFLDEADVYAPQRPFGDEARTLGACQSIVRRGRIKGIGCTLITQRPQVLNKDVLSQVDMLTVLRMNHPKDLGAIDEWVAVHGDPKLAKEMMVSLPSLPRGDAWVWAPGDDLFRRLTYRDRRTFDSGRTPKHGEKVQQPRELAHVDLERLGETIRATVERAKANDPKELRKRIAALEQQLADAKATNDGLGRHAAQMEARARELEQLPAVNRVSEDQISDIIHAFGSFSKEVHEQLVPIAAQIQATERNLGALLRGVRNPRADGVVTKIPGYERFVDRPVGVVHEIAPGQYTATLPPQPLAGVARAKLQDAIDKKVAMLGMKLPDGEKAVLTAAIQFGGVTREQLTVLLGYKKTSRNSYIQRLSAKGLIEIGDKITPTDAGVRALPQIDELPVGVALRDYWLKRLPEGEAVILRQLLNAYPSSVSRDELGQAAGYAKTSRNSYIQRLGARGLVATNREGVRASDTLFGVD